MTVLDCEKCGGSGADSKDGVRCAYCRAVLPMSEAPGAAPKSLGARCQGDCESVFLLPNYDPSSPPTDYRCLICGGDLSYSPHREVPAPELLADYATGEQEVAFLVARLLIETAEVPVDIFARMQQFRVSRVLLNGFLHTGVARAAGTADVGYREIETVQRVVEVSDASGSPAAGQRVVTEEVEKVRFRPWQYTEDGDFERFQLAAPARGTALARLWRWPKPWIDAAQGALAGSAEVELLWGWYRGLAIFLPTDKLFAESKSRVKEERAREFEQSTRKRDAQGRELERRNLHIKVSLKNRFDLAYVSTFIVAYRYLGDHYALILPGFLPAGKPPADGVFKAYPVDRDFRRAKRRIEFLRWSSLAASVLFLGAKAAWIASSTRLLAPLGFSAASGKVAMGVGLVALALGFVYFLFRFRHKTLERNRFLAARRAAKERDAQAWYRDHGLEAPAGGGP